MTVEIEKRKVFFRTKEIWFADSPYEMTGCDRLIFRECKREISLPGFECKKFTTLVIDLSQSIDDIWNNMSPSNGRKSIRRAEKAGVVVKINQNYEEFYELYSHVMKNKKMSESISLDDVKKYSTLFVAEFQGKIISGHGYIFDSDNYRSWIIGSARFDPVADKAMISNASKLVIWEAIKYAKSIGVKEFDFGGYYTGNTKNEEREKINIFKSLFGGKTLDHYIYKKDYSILFILFSKITIFLKKWYK